MTTFDGNAIAGTLNAVFGGEMTAAAGTCAACGATEPLARLHVYRDAPGVVARCGHCEAILMVIVERRGISCVNVSGFAALEQPAQLWS
ncbi:DUF6510 family protein [Amycolatopsis rhabdoformis]|uniref:DUF6510 family protein n=1 Tax=Amycolatopsis rhabdoformis TaxID=1448059 RepID=A0ABZ1IE13_9PSEU|nr:DUF6510 family protein [Amycolatopsis rhabdoformis]WSE32690.1 DUF6510 family protein [Amycolatopsis rhabdoformis]